MKAIISQSLNGALSFVCAACGKNDDGGDCLCEDCRAMLPWISGEACPGCGGEMDGVMEFCSNCLKMDVIPWCRGYALFRYEGLARRLIQQFKYRDTPELAGAMGGMMAEKIAGGDMDIDAVVPIPLHWSRLFSRGFNQSELIASIVASSLGVPMMKILRRSRRTGHQAALGREERKKNIIGAFSVKRGALPVKKSILLVDDVMTTGSTLAMASSTLGEAGADKIVVAVLARGY